MKLQGYAKSGILLIISGSLNFSGKDDIMCPLAFSAALAGWISHQNSKSFCTSSLEILFWLCFQVFCLWFLDIPCNLLVSWIHYFNFNRAAWLWSNRNYFTNLLKEKFYFCDIYYYHTVIRFSWQMKSSDSAKETWLLNSVDSFECNALMSENEIQSLVETEFFHWWGLSSEL